MSQPAIQTPEPQMFEVGRTYILARDIQMLPLDNQELPAGVSPGTLYPIRAGTHVTIYARQAGDVLTGDNSAGLPVNLRYRLQADLPFQFNKGAETDNNTKNKFHHELLGTSPQSRAPRNGAWQPGDLAYVIADTDINYFDPAANRSYKYKKGDKVWVNSTPESRQAQTPKPYKSGYYRWRPFKQETRMVHFRTPTLGWYTADYLQPGVL